MKVDAHHHLWDLKKVHYPWLMEDAVRFFGDPKPIARNYLLAEFSADARSQGFEASVHIQVGAEDGFKEAEWVDMVVRYSKTWPMVQVVFCDLTAPDVITQLDRFKELDSVVGVRQIVGRAPEEDARTGTNALLNNPNFRYISEFTHQNTACLVFETKLDDMEVTGIDLIEWNDEEKMLKLSVFIRPFSALTRVGEHMSMKLNAMS